MSSCVSSRERAKLRASPSVGWPWTEGPWNLTPSTYTTTGTQSGCDASMTRTPPENRRRLTGGADGATRGDLKARAQYKQNALMNHYAHMSVPSIGLHQRSHVYTRTNAAIDGWEFVSGICACVQEIVVFFYKCSHVHVNGNTHSTKNRVTCRQPVYMNIIVQSNDCKIAWTGRVMFGIWNVVYGKPFPTKPWKTLTETSNRKVRQALQINIR